MTQTSPTGRPATVPAGSGANWLSACESGHCVRVKFTEDGEVMLGSTHDRRVLLFTREEWLAFADGVKDGQFDDLA